MLVNNRISSHLMVVALLLTLALSACRSDQPTSVDARCVEGKNLADGGNYARALSIWGELAVDASAKMRLRSALDCLQTTGMAQDQLQATRWIIDAADAGVVEAQIFAGLLYLSGTGVSLEPAVGLAWLERAESAGSEAASFLRRQAEGSDAATGVVSEP